MNPVDAVVKAAKEHMDAWDAMEEAIEYRREVLYEEQHGQFVSDQWKEELATAVREANVVEHRTADALRQALVSLEAEERPRD